MLIEVVDLHAGSGRGGGVGGEREGRGRVREYRISKWKEAIRLHS